MRETTKRVIEAVREIIYAGSDLNLILTVDEALQILEAAAGGSDKITEYLDSVEVSETNCTDDDPLRLSYEEIASFPVKTDSRGVLRVPKRVVDTIVEHLDVPFYGEFTIGVKCHESTVEICSSEDSLNDLDERYERISHAIVGNDGSLRFSVNKIFEKNENDLELVVFEDGRAFIFPFGLED